MISMVLLSESRDSATLYLKLKDKSSPFQSAQIEFPIYITYTILHGNYNNNFIEEE
jgi:hypothetical protein